MVAKVKHDVVYFVKEAPMNPELVYSLRALEKNWKYNEVWFCGGCPEQLRPDHHMKIRQIGLNKWEKVRRNIKLVCLNDKITEDFWLFNDDFFVLARLKSLLPEFNGTLEQYVGRIKKKHGGSHTQYTLRLLGTIRALEEAGCTTFNYEVHKPMLINRRKALEVLDRFPEYGGFRSLYGNYCGFRGIDDHDVKINEPTYDRMDLVEKGWRYLSTSDNSFQNGNVGVWIRKKFKERSRFEI